MDTTNPKAVTRLHSDVALLNEGRDAPLDGRGWRDERPPQQRQHLSVGRIGRRLEGYGVTAL